MTQTDGDSYEVAAVPCCQRTPHRNLPALLAPCCSHFPSASDGHSVIYWKRQWQVRAAVCKWKQGMSLNRFYSKASQRCLGSIKENVYHKSAPHAPLLCQTSGIHVPLFALLLRKKFNWSCHRSRQRRNPTARHVTQRKSCFAASLAYEIPRF